MKNSEKLKSPIENLYAIEDIKAGRFFPPFLSVNDDTAVRSFTQMINHPGASISAFDLRLFMLGDFDPNDGQIDVLNAPAHIISGSELAQKQPELQNQSS